MLDDGLGSLSGPSANASWNVMGVGGDDNEESGGYLTPTDSTEVIS